MEDRQGEEQWKGSNRIDFLFQDGTLSQVEYDLLDEEDEDEEEVTYSDGEEYESAEDGEGEDEQGEDAEEREHREPEEINTVPASITCHVNTIVAQGPLSERVVSFCVLLCVVASCQLSLCGWLSICLEENVKSIRGFCGWIPDGIQGIEEGKFLLDSIPAQ